MSATTFRHDPDAVLDYAFDFRPWLADGETVDGHTVTITAGTATIGTVTHADGLVTVFISGAVPGRVDLTCQIVTSQGRTDDRTLTLRVGNR